MTPAREETALNGGSVSGTLRSSLSERPFPSSAGGCDVRATGTQDRVGCQKRNEVQVDLLLMVARNVKVEGASPMFDSGDRSPVQTYDGDLCLLCEALSRKMSSRRDKG